jgi:hypothetical protein
VENFLSAVGETKNEILRKGVSKVGFSDTLFNMQVKRIGRRSLIQSHLQFGNFVDSCLAIVPDTFSQNADLYDGYDSDFLCLCIKFGIFLLDVLFGYDAVSTRAPYMHSSSWWHGNRLQYHHGEPLPGRAEI